MVEPEQDAGQWLAAARAGSGPGTLCRTIIAWPFNVSPAAAAGELSRPTGLGGRLMRHCFMFLLVSWFVLPWSAMGRDKPPAVPAKFLGAWTVTAAEFCGKKPPANIVSRLQVTIKQKSIEMSNLTFLDGEFKIVGDPVELPYEINPTAKEIDLFLKDGDKQHRMLGIYSDDGDILKLCWQHDGKQRPKEFKTAESPVQLLLILKRTKDLELLQGTWNIDTMEWGAKSLPKELMNGYKFVVAGNKLTWDGAIGMQSKGGKVMAINGTYPCDFKIDPGKEPKQIDITLHLKKGDQTVDRTVLGIYEIKGDTLKVCYFGSTAGKRPAEFSTKDDGNIACIVLTRAKK